MKTIFDFKQGDKITRLKPSKGYGDRSYMGDELTFIGIANNQIYYTNKKSPFGEEHISNLALDLWSEDWDYFIDPKTLLNGNEIILSSLTIEQQIQKAIENEDYELANKLTKNNEK